MTSFLEQNEKTIHRGTISLVSYLVPGIWALLCTPGIVSLVYLALTTKEFSVVLVGIITMIGWGPLTLRVVITRSTT